jgi:hypothetical protein
MFGRQSSYGFTFATTSTSAMKRPDLREGESIESKCNKTMVDLITKILVKYHIHTMIISEYIKCGII